LCNIVHYICVKIDKKISLFGLFKDLSSIQLSKTRESSLNEKKGSDLKVV